MRTERRQMEGWDRLASYFLQISRILSFSREHARDMEKVDLWCGSDLTAASLGRMGWKEGVGFLWMERWNGLRKIEQDGDECEQTDGKLYKERVDEKMSVVMERKKMKGCVFVCLCVHVRVCTHAQGYIIKWKWTRFFKAAERFLPCIRETIWTTRLRVR